MKRFIMPTLTGALTIILCVPFVKAADARQVRSGNGEPSIADKHLQDRLDDLEARLKVLEAIMTGEMSFVQTESKLKEPHDNGDLIDDCLRFLKREKPFIETLLVRPGVRVNIDEVFHEASKQIELKDFGFYTVRIILPFHDNEFVLEAGFELKCALRGKRNFSFYDAPTYCCVRIDEVKRTFERGIWSNEYKGIYLDESTFKRVLSEIAKMGNSDFLNDQMMSNGEYILKISSHSDYLRNVGKTLKGTSPP